MMATMVVSSPLHAHPDGATPYFYTSAWIYGFVDGCAQKIEESQLEWVGNMWPEQVRSVCGCVVDALRHSQDFEQVQIDPPTPIVQTIVDLTLPVCIREEQQRAKDSILGG